MSEVRIVKHINRFNTSNTYLLYTEGSPEVWTLIREMLLLYWIG